MLWADAPTFDILRQDAPPSDNLDRRPIGRVCLRAVWFGPEPVVLCGRAVLRRGPQLLLWSATARDAGFLRRRLSPGRGCLHTPGSGRPLRGWLRLRAGRNQREPDVCSPDDCGYSYLIGGGAADRRFPSERAPHRVHGSHRGADQHSAWFPPPVSGARPTPLLA